MTINAQGGVGKIRLFEDFCGAEYPVAESGAVGWLGDFRVIGDGISETDTGIPIDEATCPLSGVGIFTTSGDDKHACGLGTALCFDVGLMGPIIMECRVQFADGNTKGFVFGLTNENADDVSIEDDIISNDAATTLTISADDFVGFYFDAELTDAEDWHMVYKGGTTSAETTSSNIDADDVAVDGEWQILRVEIDPNGTARWYIDGVLKQTVEGAASTTEDLAVVCLVGDHAGGAELAYVDYVLVEANRDWNA
jgi:hypothetical protein